MLSGPVVSRIRGSTVLVAENLNFTCLPIFFQVMILSQPSRRYNDSVAMIPELLQLGGYICIE